MRLALDVPDHTTLSRRGSTLKVNLGVLQSKKPMHLIIDSTGLSIVGEGEWGAAKHGGSGKRGWRKLHLGVDADGMIQTQILTKSNGDDATTGSKIINKSKGKLSCVTGDAAHDKIAFYKAAKPRGHGWSFRRAVRHRSPDEDHGRLNATGQFARSRS